MAGKIILYVSVTFLNYLYCKDLIFQGSVHPTGITSILYFRTTDCVSCFSSPQESSSTTPAQCFGAVFLFVLNLSQKQWKRKLIFWSLHSHVQCPSNTAQKKPVQKRLAISSHTSTVRSCTPEVLLQLETRITGFLFVEKSIKSFLLQRSYDPA